MAGYRPAKGQSLLWILVFAMILAASVSAASRKGKKKAWKLPKTFTLEDAGIELTLNGGWAPQPPPVGKSVVKMLTSLRDLSQIILTPLPFQVELSQETLAQRSDELVRSVRLAHPDFVPAQTDLIEGDPPRLHMEGTWSVEGQAMNVCLEVLPVRGMSLLLLLMTQKKSGNTFRALADGIREQTKTLKKPVPAPAPADASFDLGDVVVRMDLAGGWRAVLDVEKTFVAKQLMEDGLYADSQTLEKAVMLARPTLLPFSPTLTLRSSEGAVPVAEENLEKFRALYDDRIGATSPSFELDAITIVKVGGVEAFLARGMTDRTSMTVATRQLFIPLGSRTVIATLNVLADEEESCVSCGRLFEAMSFEVKPPAASAPPRLPELPGPERPSASAFPLRWAAAAAFIALILLLAAVGIRRAGKKKE